MKEKKIISVVGARPNFMKLAPIAFELKKYRKRITHKILHTGQHYDHKLSQIFFKDLDLPEPDIYLGIGSASHAEQTARIMHEFEKAVHSEKPDLVLVYGDVNSTLACAVVCSKIHHGRSTLPVAHIEAGLRSYDRSMPEEINRIVTDSLSEMLFVTEKRGASNLLDEGIPKKRIHLVGDTLIDSLIQFKGKFNRSKILKELSLNSKKYVLLTIHRPVNTDKKENLAKIVSILEKLSHRTSSDKIVFPVHPRTMKMINEFGLLGRLRSIKGLLVTEPAGYTDFIKLLTDCRLVITDSGGIQEESTYLRVPCLTLRDSFERPETIALGTNTLCGLDEKLILHKAEEVFAGKYKKGRIPRLMDGMAARRIVKIILQKMK